MPVHSQTKLSTGQTIICLVHNVWLVCKARLLSMLVMQLTTGLPAYRLSVQQVLALFSCWLSVPLRLAGMATLCLCCPGQQ